MKVVYSEQRARLLRRALRAVQVLAAAMVVVAVWVGVRAQTNEAGQVRATALLYVITLVLQACVLVGVVRLALRRLPQRSTDARMWCLATAGLTLLSSLPLLSTVVGIAAVFVGLFLLTLAARKDSEE